MPRRPAFLVLLALWGVVVFALVQRGMRAWQVRRSGFSQVASMVDRGAPAQAASDPIVNGRGDGGAGDAAPMAMTEGAGDEPPMPGGVTLRGRVRRDGAAVPRAEITLSGGARATSDEQGAFIASGLTAGRHALRVTAAGAAAYLDAVQVPAQLPLTIDLQPAPELRIRVLDGATRPLAGVVVMLREGQFAPLPRAGRTDEMGAFAFAAVLPGSYLVSASAEGYAPASVAVRAPIREVTLRLARAATAAGDVVDEAGHPVANARVAVSRDDGWTVAPVASAAPIGGRRAAPLVEPAGELGIVRGPIPYPPLDGPASAMETAEAAATLAAATPAAGADPDRGTVARSSGGSALTDGAGHFRLSGVAAGRVVLVASHPAFADGRSAPLSLSPGAETRVRLVLRKASSLHGRVVDAHGVALPGAELWVGGTLAVIADKRGAFELRRLVGPVDVEVRARGFLPSRRRVDPAQPGEVELVVGAPEQRVTGVVVDGRGLPVVGARVSIERAGQRAGQPEGAGAAGLAATVLTDGNGEFALAVSGTGPLALHVTHGEHQKAGATDVMPGDDVRVTMSAGGTVDGEIIDAHGGRPAGAKVRVDDAAGERHVGTVDAGGRFRVTGCPPGAATLVAEAPGFLTVRADLDLPVAEKPGEVVLRDVRVSLAEAGTVMGMLRDRHGAPVAGALVEGGGAKARTDGGGRFTLGPVAAGATIEVTAHAAEGNVAESVSVERGRAASLDLRLP